MQVPFLFSQEERILHQDLPRTFGINKQSGQIFQTSFRISRFFNPESQEALNQLGVYRRIYNEVFFKSIMNSYRAKDIIIDAKDLL